LEGASSHDLLNGHALKGNVFFFLHIQHKLMQQAGLVVALQVCVQVVLVSHLCWDSGYPKILHEFDVSHPAVYQTN
jgi:hypothetical protein